MTSPHQAQPVPPPATVPAFSPPVDPETAFVASKYARQTVAPNHVLIAQDEQPTTVALIRSGIVQLTHLGADGNENTLGLRSEGWWAGGVLAVLHLPSLCAVKALTECSFSSIPAEDFLNTIMQNQRTLRHFLTTLARELLIVQQHSIMQGSSAAERLRYLQEESSQSVWSTVDPTLVMRQNEIARLLSISPEHLSRLMNREGRPPRKD
jgi:CRP-like cAMP-binding protein